MKQFSTLRSACISRCNSSMYLYRIDFANCSANTVGANTVGAKRRSRPVALVLAEMVFCSKYTISTVYKNKYKEIWSLILFIDNLMDQSRCPVTKVKRLNVIGLL